MCSRNNHVKDTLFCGSSSAEVPVLAPALDKLELIGDKRLKAELPVSFIKSVDSISNDNRIKRCRKKFAAYNLSTKLLKQVDVLMSDSISSEQSNVNIIPYRDLVTIKKSYINMLNCGSYVEIDGGKVSTYYCKNSLCSVCNNIKTAEKINKYDAYYKTWNDVHFVTLTAEYVEYENLRSRVDFMNKTYTCIRKSIERRCSRNGENKPRGFKKIESTYNKPMDRFHPHFHIIIEGRDKAEKLRDEWLRKFSDAGIKVDRKAQHIEKCGDGTLKELFKYVTKVNYNTKRTAKGGNKSMVYLSPLIKIQYALRGIKCISHFGFKLSDLNDNEYLKEGISIINSYKVSDVFAAICIDFMRWKYYDLVEGLLRRWSYYVLAADLLVKYSNYLFSDGVSSSVWLDDVIDLVGSGRRLFHWNQREQDYISVIDNKRLTYRKEYTLYGVIPVYSDDNIYIYDGVKNKKRGRLSAPNFAKSYNRGNIPAQYVYDNKRSSSSDVLDGMVVIDGRWYEY